MKTRVEWCRTLSTSALREVFKPTTSFCSGWIEWRNAHNEAACSIGYGFSQQPAPTFTIFYSAIRQNSQQDRQDFRYPIKLATTPCRYGGLRYWFICPLVKNGHSCRRRVTKLYLPPGSTYFGCRHCYKLTYRSCQEHDGRLNELLKNPELLRAMLDSKKPRRSILALKAVEKTERW